MSKWQLVLILGVLVSWPALARPIGYQVPLEGGPLFIDDHALFVFVATHEILKSMPPDVALPGAPPQTVPSDPISLQRLSRVESIDHNYLGALQIVYLPTWCGHRHATDHIAYVLRVVPRGRQLVGRVEYESMCHLSSSSPYKVVCDSYHGAKGWSTQTWRGKSFQWAPFSS